MAIDFEPQAPQIDFEPIQIDFEPETPVAGGTARVAQMAAATRDTLGVVGRAIAATDIAQAGAEAPETGRIELDQPDESSLALEPPVPLAARRRPLQPLPASTLLDPMFGRFPRVTAQEVADALSYLASASPDLTQEESDAVIENTMVPGNLEKIIAGAQRAAINIPEAATTPLGVATLGAGALPATAGRAVSGVFAVDMARHIPGQVKELRAAVLSGDSERISEASGNLLATGLMTGAATAHAVRPTLPQVAPLTAEAVAKTTAAPLQETASTLTPLTTEAARAATEKGTYASSISQAAEVYGPLRPQPIEDQGPVPTERGGTGIQSQTQSGIPTPVGSEKGTVEAGRVPETPAPTPAAAASELGTISPVTAGEIPPAREPLAQSTPLAKVISEQPLTRVPEQFLPSKALQDILTGQEATPPVQGGLRTGVTPAPEGGALFGAGGRRATPPSAVGVTPRGDPNWLRIPSAIKRVGRGLFTEGARAVLARTKNQTGRVLAEATRRHVDIEQELFGQHEAVLRRAVDAIPKERLDPALTEASQYLREVENRRPAPAVSAEARSLLDAWFQVGRSTGNIARANNVQVLDQGGYRPMGTVENYVPRMFRTEVEAVLRDPQADPALFNQLAQAIATQKGITLEEGAAQLRGVAGRFQANDYMANLELARSEQMPEIFYDYNLRNLAARYLPSYSERMAQIIAYGQRLGPREAPQRMNLWDIARREAEDATTQEWLNAAEDQATAFKPRNALERGARRAQAIASATLLSDPTTTVVRNLLSGLSATTEQFGFGRSLPAFREAMTTASRLNARQAGVIRDDLAAFINADQLGNSPIDAAIRDVTAFSLRVSGFTGSENFARTHNAITASSFLRDAAAALQANPRSKLSREALAHFKRWDINAETVIKEGGNWIAGAESRKYVRTAVREMQGGYRFDQVPVWANSTAGRFFYQYGRWGVQRAQNIFQNIIKPAIGEEVTFRGERMVHRDVLPLIRAAALTVGLGETFGAIAFGLFGKDRRDSSLSEIAEAWTEDELRAVSLAGERIVNDIIMAGTLGIIGQPLDIAKAAKDQSRFKNPLDPPSAAGIKTLVNLAQRAIDQDGTLTKRDWLDAASGVVRGPKNVADVARNLAGESLYEGQNDQRTLRNAARRWAEETKQDVPLKALTEIRKSPNSPFYEAVNDALLSGDVEAAKKAADDFVSKQTDKSKATEALRASVRARQPFRAGNLSSEENRNRFMDWARKNLSEADLNQINRVQERYRQTAIAAGLL